MASEQPAIETVLVRLEKLERANRRLRWTSGAVLALLAGVLLTGAKSAGNTRRISVSRPARFTTVVCDRLVVLGRDGRPGVTISDGDLEPRAKIGSGANAWVQPWLPADYSFGGPAIWFWGSRGTLREMIYSQGLWFYERSAHGVQVTRAGLGPSYLQFNSPDGSQAILLGGGTPAQHPLSLAEQLRVLENYPPAPPDPALILGTQAKGILLTALGGPSIWVHGQKSLADSTLIGSTTLYHPLTGSTVRTSPASIVMFGNSKDHHVIWQAPY